MLRRRGGEERFIVSGIVLLLIVIVLCLMSINMSKAMKLQRQINNDLIDQVEALNYSIYVINDRIHEWDKSWQK